jgi:hypothetical protein
MSEVDNFTKLLSNGAWPCAGAERRPAPRDDRNDAQTVVRDASESSTGELRIAA